MLRDHPIRSSPRKRGPMITAGGHGSRLSRCALGRDDGRTGSREEPTCTCGQTWVHCFGLLLTMKIPTQACERQREKSPRSEERALSANRAPRRATLQLLLSMRARCAMDFGQAQISKKKPRRVAPPGSSAQLVTRASRNDVAVDADAQSVVVLILDRVEGARLGGAAQLTCAPLDADSSFW